MKIAEIQFTPWDKKYYFRYNNIDLGKGDYAIVETSLGLEIGKVAGLMDVSEEEALGFVNKEKSVNGVMDIENTDNNTDGNNFTLKSILRKANSNDIKNLVGYEERQKALKYCREIAVKYELPMKLVDVYFAFDQSRITFAFIADGRIDFRELVKDLTRHFNKPIRLHQIGIRDEAKLCGDCGVCGRELCCKGFLNNLVSITSEMAEIQEVAHRGSERISGICGRLMCCLAYEQSGYKDLIEKMPKVGTKVSKDGKRGVIVGVHPLKNSVDVEFKEKNDEYGRVTEVSLKKDN